MKGSETWILDTNKSVDFSTHAVCIFWIKTQYTTRLEKVENHKRVLDWKV